MERFDQPTEPLTDCVRRAREAGKKKVNIAGIPVDIHKNYALFGDRSNTKSTKKKG